MTIIKLSVREIRERGIWDKVCDYNSWSKDIFDDGEIHELDEIEFDDRILEKETDYTENTKLTYTYNVKESYTSNYVNWKVQELEAYNLYDACYQLAKEIGYESIYEVKRITTPLRERQILEVVFMSDDSKLVIYQLKKAL